MQHGSGLNGNGDTGPFVRLWRTFVGIVAACAMLFVAVPAASANEGYDDADTAKAVNPNQTVTGSLIDRDDWDWYKVSLPSTGVLNLTFTNQQASKGEWYVKLYDSELQELDSYTFGANATGHGDTTKIGVPAGSYWVSVNTGWYEDDASTLEYQLRVNYFKASNWEVERNDKSDVANALATGKTVHGTLINRDGWDWYKVSLPSTGVLNLTFTNQQASKGEWYVKLYDSELQELDSYTFGANAVSHGDTTKIGVPAGSYWVSVNTGWYEDDASTLEYQLRVNYFKASNWEVERNDKFETANVVAPGAVVNGSIMDDDDYDFYKVITSASDSLKVRFTNPQTTDGSWLVTLFDGSNFNELYTEEFNGSETDHSGRTLVLPKGTYYVRVDVDGGRGSTPFGKSYAVSFGHSDDPIGETEENDSADTANPLKVNQTIAADMSHSYDNDWFKFSVGSADTAQFVLNNAETNGDGYYKVNLINANGMKQVASYQWNAGTKNHASSLIDLSAGTYYVQISDHDMYEVKYTFRVNWGKPRFTVAFDSNGGSGVASQTVVQGAKAKQPANPTRNGKVFAGWFTAKSGGAKADFNKAVNGNVTYYAHWNDPPFSQFWDVTRDTPHGADINWLVGQKITTGYKDGSFRGGAPVVRQDMAAFLYRLAGSPSFDVNGARNPFVDVNPSTPHYKEILWLASTGISTGWRTPRGVEFRGMNAVVRQDMAAFLKRLADYREAKPALGKAVSFRDVNAGTPHSAEIAWLSRTGVTTGWKDGTFRGMNAVVRQDMAAFLHRMKANVIK